VQNTRTRKGKQKVNKTAQDWYRINDTSGTRAKNAKLEQM